MPIKRCRVIAVALLCCTTAYSNSNIYEPLAVPKAEDVVLFTNGLAPATGERIRKKKENILEFLRHGKNNLDVRSWYEIERARDPEKIVVCDGVFTDKAGKIYFWRLIGNDVLKLQTAEGEYALLQLQKK